MIPAIGALLLVLILRGAVALLPILTLPITIVAWPLALFLLFSIVADLTHNIPQFLTRGATTPPIEALQDWKQRYVLVMGVSLFIRLITGVLITEWFLFREISIFGA